MFKSSIISFILLSLFVSSLNAQTPFAYGIWNDETNTVNAGTINLNTVQEYSNFTFPGYTFSNTTSCSSYNSQTGQLSFISVEIASNITYLTTVDTTQVPWVATSNSHVDGMNFVNIAFDGTEDPYNLLGVFYTGDNKLYVGRISVGDHYYKAIDTIDNVFPNATAAYINSQDLYVVCYQTLTFDQACNYYNQDNQKIGPKIFSVTNMASPWVAYSSAYLLNYLPYQDSLICQMIIVNKGYSTFYGGAQMFWMRPGTSEFKNNGFISSSIRNQVNIYYNSFSALALPRVFQFAQATFNGVDGYYMYTYSTYNNQWTLTQKANVGVLNAWSFA